MPAISPYHHINSTFVAILVLLIILKELKVSSVRKPHSEVCDEDISPNPLLTPPQFMGTKCRLLSSVLPRMKKKKSTKIV